MENVLHPTHALAIKVITDYHPTSASHCVKEGVKTESVLLPTPAFVTAATGSTLTSVYPRAQTLA